jgi:hypothetical protein
MSKTNAVVHSFFFFLLDMMKKSMEMMKKVGSLMYRMMFMYNQNWGQHDIIVSHNTVNFILHD